MVLCVVVVLRVVVVDDDLIISEEKHEINIFVKHDNFLSLSYVSYITYSLKYVCVDFSFLTLWG